MAQNRRRSYRWIRTLVFLILLAAAAIICYLVWDNYFRDKDKGEDETTSNVSTVIADNGSEEKKDDNPTEQDEQIKDDDGSLEKDEEKELGFDGVDPNVYQDLTGAVTFAGVMDDELMVRVNIDQYLAEGNCYLELRKGADTVYDSSVSIVSSAATATCEGFNVPISEVMDGHLIIQITLNSGDKSGLISGEVDI